MTTDETSIKTTVRHLELVTAEIEKLRDAVAIHQTAAEGLHKAGSALADLSLQLQRLPSDLKSEFSGVSELVSGLNEALKPAGSLEAEIRELVAGGERLAIRLQQERQELCGIVDKGKKETEEMLGKLGRDCEMLGGEMRAIREDIKELRAFCGEQQAQTYEAAQRISEMSAHSGKQLSFLYGELKKNASAQTSVAESIDAKLSKLIELGRRGFFDQIRGKDT